MAFERVYGPLGAERGDYHAAQVETAILNTNRIYRQPWTIAERLLRWQSTRRIQTVEEMEILLTDYLRRAGARRRT